MDKPEAGLEYQPRDDFAKSVQACYDAIKERVAKGGKPWVPGPCQCPACRDPNDKA